MNFYKSISKYYDEIFPLNKMQVKFVSDSFTGKLSGKKILDIGCGTGNLAIALSDLDFQVTGIDLDREMIRISSEKEIGNKIHFEEMDMELIADKFSENSIDAITCFGNTIVHLQNIDRITEFFKSCKKILKPQGKLLFQVLNYSYILSKVIRELPIIENELIKFERYYEFSKSQSLPFKTVLTIKESNKKVENKIHLYPVTKNEIEKALIDAGFKNFSVYSGFNRKEYDFKSLPLIVECE